MTKVVNIYKEPYDVYIGRAGKGKDGYFGNPFPMFHENGRNIVILKYENWFKERIKSDPEFKAKVLALKGKTLGCFCKPKACHGDVIAKWVDEQP